MQTLQINVSTGMLPGRQDSGRNTRLVCAPVLAGALAFMAAGGVQATNTYPLAMSSEPKGKAAAHYIFSHEGMKLVKAAEPLSTGPQWVDDINWIRQSTDVTVSRLAELFGVTRKAFYGWTEGAEPRKGGSLTRIATLRELLERLPTDLHRTALLMLADEPMGADGMSMRSALQCSVEDLGYRERLNEKLAEILPAIDNAAKRLDRSAGVTAAYESDYPTA